PVRSGAAFRPGCVRGIRAWSEPEGSFQREEAPGTWRFEGSFFVLAMTGITASGFAVTGMEKRTERLHFTKS
ncbi:MAG: hypothetical protein JSV84_05255, partial [Gemmatimonadota bacterium]